jgi:anti-anti-sigma factor
MDLSADFCSIRAVATERVVTIHVRGEIDLATAPQLNAAFGSVNGLGVEVDLSEMTFCDASGLRVLERAHDRLGARLRVTGASPLVRRLAGILDMEWLAEDGPGQAPVR